MFGGKIGGMELLVIVAIASAHFWPEQTGRSG